MSKKDKKEILFNLFSNNLEGILDNVKNKNLFPQSRGCYCPICETHFSSDELSKLSLEHNPPKSLGGKDNILTCISCNNIAGSKVDSEILLALHEFDLMKFKPNATLKTRFFNDSTGDAGVNGNFKIDENGKFIINISSANNPKTKEAFLNSFEYNYAAYDIFKDNLENSGLTRKLEFRFAKPNKRNDKLASVSLLKIAYLIGFEKLGHIFIFGEHMKLIRDQIKNPDKEIIKHPFWIHNNYPDNMLGINIITKPTELKSFLFVFDLITKSDKYRVGICIPGYHKDADEVYKNIESILCTGNGYLEIETNNFLNSNFDIRDKENALFPIRFWEELFE